MAVAAIVDGKCLVGSLVTAEGSATNEETLTAYEWQCSDGESATYAAVGGATSQTYTIEQALRCKWLRVRIAFDDGGNTVYAYSSPKRVGPCGGGRAKARAPAQSSAAERPASVPVPVAAAPVVPVAQKRLRRIYKVDTSKWVEGRRPR